MEAIVFCLYVLISIMHGDNNVSSDAVNARVERVHSALNFGDHSALRFFPLSASGIFPANAMNPIMRVLPVRLVYATDLQIHFPTASYSKVVMHHRQPRRSQPANPQIRGLAYHKIKKSKA